MATFWVTKLKLFSGKVRRSVLNCLNQSLIRGTFLENGFETTLSSKRSVVSVWKGHFSVFVHFWVTKLRLFSGKLKQSVQSYLNQNLVIGSFLENGFEATLSSKRNVLSVWKGAFSVFSKVLGDQVETIFWKTQAKRPKLFKSKVGHRKLLGKWFWSHLHLKKECYERLKRSFFSFCTFFCDEVETIFWESETEHLRQFKSKFGHRKFLKKWFCSYLDLKNEVSWCLKRPFSSFLQRFEWRSWNYFLASWGGTF